MYRHLSALYWERVGKEISVSVIEGRVRRIQGTVEFIAYCSDTSGMNLSLDS